MFKKKVRKSVLRLAKKSAKWANDFSYNFDRNGEKWGLGAVEGLNFKVIFDVGANVGDWTKAVKGIHPDADVHCFELSKDTFNTLKEKVKFSGVVLNNVGLSNTSGDIEYKDYGKNSGVNTLLTTSVFHDANIQPKILTGEVMTGDQYCEKVGVHAIDFLKIDVEGAESYVLEGFTDMLSDARVRMIQFEYGCANGDARYLMRDFYNLFSRYGYIVGKLRPEGVDFMGWTYSLNDFDSGPNYIAIKQSDIELHDILSPS